MSRQNQYKQIACLLATGAIAAFCNPVWSSAFQLMEQNVTNLGTAYAGTASLAIDASTGFYNSAGLTRICQEQIAFSVVGIKTTGRINVSSARDTTGFALPNNPSNARIIGDGLSPGLHYAYRLNDNFVFGFNVVMPFGLKTGYREDSPVRYMSTRTELRTYDISPSLAYSFCNGLSIGAGVDFVHAFAQFDTTVGTVDPALVAIGATDGFNINKAEGWGTGGHVGALYEFDDFSRIGINYRSEVKFETRGETLSQPFGPAIGGPVERSDLRANTRLPATAVISAFHQLTDCWAIMGDVQWTQWKSFKTLALVSEDPFTGASSSQTITNNFKDSFRYALGMHYQLNDCWLFRIGAAYDETPVRNQLRNSRIPDSNRTWLALGGRYTINECLNLDFGYSHVFFRNTSISESAPRAAGTFQGAQQLNGNVRNAADLLGIQLTWDLA